MIHSARAALFRGPLLLLSLLLLALVPNLATASPVSAGDPLEVALVGDETIGVLPVNAEVTRSRSVDSRLVVIERELAGEDLGTKITAQRGAILLVARAGPPGQESAVVAGEPWTASWVSSGTTFTITITQLPNETDDQAAERLDRKVRAMQRLRPRDGDKTGAAGAWLLPPRQSSLRLAWFAAPPGRLLSA